MQHWWNITSSCLSTLGEHFHFACGGAGTTNGFQILDAFELWAHPFWTGRGGHLVSLRVGINSISGTTALWAGIYGAQGRNYPFPRERIFDLGSTAATVAGDAVWSTAGGYGELPPGALVFATILSVNTVPQVVGLTAPMAQYGLDVASMLTPLVTVNASWGVGSGPAIFPTSFTLIASAVACGLVFQD